MFWIVVGVLIICYWFFHSPLCRAVSEQIRSGVADEDDILRRVEALTDEVHAEVRDLRAEIVELAERVDFTERVLVEMRQRDALPSRRD